MIPFSSAIFLTRFSPEDAILLALIVRQTLAVSGEGDHVRHFGFGGAGDVRPHVGLQLVVVLLAVPAVRNAARAGGQRRNQAILADRRPVVRLDQVDAADADVGRLPAEVVEWNLAVAPAGGGLFQTAGRGCGGWTGGG